MTRLTEEKGKKAGIFGLARTGFAAYEALKGIAEVVCYDDNEQNQLNFISKFGEESLRPIDDPAWRDLDYIVLSPGVPLYFPTPHPVVVLANQHKIPLIADIELFYRNMPDAKYIGITGTNGKSTTTALIAHIMGSGFVACGNIGASPLSFDLSEGYVLELSSYQLDLIESFRPKIAVCLNITPDHIERHNSMQGYIEAKKLLWRNMSSSDTLVIGVDNEVTKGIYDELKGRAPFDIIPITAHDKIEGLPYNQSLLGLHNMENIAASYAVSRAMGKSHDEIMHKIASFGGLRHRMQFVGKCSNVGFYNDSKATNAEAASKSLGSLENVYWLVGGQSKEGGIESLTPLFSRVKKAYLFGEARHEFAKNLEGRTDYVICETMKEGFDLALEDALKDSTYDGITEEVEANILLAPACASFDQFKSFEQRGDEFVELCKKSITKDIA